MSPAIDDADAYPKSLNIGSVRTTRQTTTSIEEHLEKNDDSSHARAPELALAFRIS